jgi:hypothetical protein
MDDDDSGLITYDEILAVTRKQMKLKKAELSDEKVKNLWCALDAECAVHPQTLHITHACGLDAKNCHRCAA